MDIHTGVTMKIHDVTRLISNDMTVYKDRESKKIKTTIVADYENADY